MKNPLLSLQSLGQSPWHDNIRRDLLTSGRLAEMIAQGDITGLTSNPTIFEQAIAGSEAYNDSLAALAEQGKTPAEIFDALSIEDIQAAADLFLPIYERTKSIDGYVSIEVAPNLAHDTEQTLSEARRLWRVVNRPNLMVKIPATLAGLPAIESAIADGINVNVTLIFSLERYEAVVAAYLAGLRTRAERGEPLAHVASVASFFVSRVDSSIDAQLDKIQPNHPARGKAAIANAALAYASFLRTFRGEAFADLAAKGAQPQRPLWASTSAKDPAYPDTYYVEALIGPDTVNTMPPATLDAYRDHGNPADRIESAIPGALGVLNELAEAGVDFNAVLDSLEKSGVASFTKSYDTLLAVVADRSAVVLQQTMSSSGKS